MSSNVLQYEVVQYQWKTVAQFWVTITEKLIQILNQNVHLWGTERMVRGRIGNVDITIFGVNEFTPGNVVRLILEIRNDGRRRITFVHRKPEDNSAIAISDFDVGSLAKTIKNHFYGCSEIYTKVVEALGNEG